MKYIKQLDSVRAIAVLLVILSHWIPKANLDNRIPYGEIGVDIFFVLSGFLISRILFDNRNKAEILSVPKSAVVKSFYIRRTLRIFPIYYLTIFLLLIFSESTGTNIKSAFLYLATYTSNFYFFNIQAWDGIISHLWSLAVEEQFYLIWPWIILFINKKYLLHVITCFILIGVLSQYFLYGVKMSAVLTFTCFDAFGLGALLAWLITYSPEKLKRFYSVISVIAAVSVVFFVTGIVQRKWTFIPIRTISSCMALWLITYIIFHNRTNTLKFKLILNNKILIFLGKISYGLYLYHNLIPTFNKEIIDKYINPLLPDILYKRHTEKILLLENTILLLVISWLSYILIEKWFLNLKEKFKYQHERNEQRSLAVGEAGH